MLRRSNGQNAALEDKPRCKPEHDTKADADSHIGQNKAHRSLLGSETLRPSNCDEQSRASGGTAAILCVTHDAGLRWDGDEIPPKAAAELRVLRPFRPHRQISRPVAKLLRTSI